MKANEFVKKFGLVEAKSRLIDCEVEYVDCFESMGVNVDTEDLKRLVEAWELVEYMGGIDKAKEQAYVLTMEVNGFNPEKLEKAITDVESCQ